MQDTLEECKKYGLPLVLEMEESLCNFGLYTPGSKDGGILALEQSLLDIGSNSEVVQGLFYVLALKTEQNLFIR